MRAAHDPWWIIGSAAVWLHGARTDVADVDVLTSVGDAGRLFGLQPRGDDPAETLFRSRCYGRLDTAALPIEIMAGLHVRHRGRWEAVLPATRRTMTAGDSVVHVPDRAELIAILHRFGRAKDDARAALLEQAGSR